MATKLCFCCISLQIILFLVTIGSLETKTSSISKMIPHPYHVKLSYLYLVPTEQHTLAGCRRWARGWPAVCPQAACWVSPAEAGQVAGAKWWPSQLACADSAEGGRTPCARSCRKVSPAGGFVGAGASKNKVKLFAEAVKGKKIPIMNYFPTEISGFNELDPRASIVRFVVNTYILCFRSRVSYLTSTFLL